LDRAYPSGHSSLFGTVGHAGVVCSEYPPGTPPTKYRFQRRNRVTAALSGRLVVVEAGERSGSVAAAGERLAAGDKVGIVPGPITSATSRGSNQLLREGAFPIMSAEDIAAL
jgi:DNA processing protein